MAKVFIQSTVDVLDYKIDFTKWLAKGGADTISSYVVTPDAGITVNNVSITDSSQSITMWVSGGTVDRNYNVSCRVLTADGRTRKRTITFYIRDLQ